MSSGEPPDSRLAPDSRGREYLMSSRGHRALLARGPWPDRSHPRGPRNPRTLRHRPDGHCREPHLSARQGGQGLRGLLQLPALQVGRGRWRRPSHIRGHLALAILPAFRAADMWLVVEPGAAGLLSVEPPLLTEGHDHAHGLLWSANGPPGFHCVGHVSDPRDIFKIVQPRIPLIAILVVYFPTRWTRP